MIKDSQTKSCKRRANEWLSEEYKLLGLNEYGSKYITQRLKRPFEKVQGQERASQTQEKEENLKISKGRLTTSHKMHNNNFTGCIYVEKMSEQYYIG